MMNPKDNKKFNKGGRDRNRNPSCGGGRNIQDLFLNYVTENHTPVTVFLVCGVRLQGIITYHDVYTLLLKREGHTQLVFKHSVSTIMPIDPIQFMSDEEKQQGGNDKPAAETNTAQAEDDIPENEDTFATGEAEASEDEE